MQTESKQPHSKASLQRGRQILDRRKEIEQELVDMLKETDPTSPRLRRGKEQFTLQDVKDAIFNEEDNDDMMKVVTMFDRGGDATELEKKVSDNFKKLDL